MHNQTVALATRVPVHDLPEFFAWLERVQHPAVTKVYVVSDASSAEFAEASAGDSRCQNIYDPNPTRPTAYNLVIDELNKQPQTQHHLLAISREVQLQDEHIQKMLSVVETSPKCIVAGYKLRDNVLTERERQDFTGSPPGIAYIVPWSTCAIWNRVFVYGEGDRRLRFDPLCDGVNDLGEITVELNGTSYTTAHAGMEDGLAIAELLQRDPTLWYALLDPELPWYFGQDEHRRLKHKIKMARKNTVLQDCIVACGYSADAVRAAARTVGPVNEEQ